MIVRVLESFSLHSILFHFVIVKSANRIQIWKFLQFFELLFGFVKIKDTFNAIEMLSDIVFVLVDTKSSLDLILEHLDDLFVLIIIER